MRHTVFIAQWILMNIVKKAFGIYPLFSGQSKYKKILVKCQQILSQRFVNFYFYLLAIYCEYKQFFYRLLSKKTNTSKMAVDLLGSYQYFWNN